MSDQIKYIEAIKSKIEMFEQLGREPSMSSKQINNQLLANNIIIANTTEEEIRNAT